MKLYPAWFTRREGGDWEEWKAGPIKSKKQLALIVSDTRNHTVINNVLFHSLAFENPAAGWNRFARWDCLNGWTTTLKQARERWSNGLHNQSRTR